jgi:hypothetical protein
MFVVLQVAGAGVAFALVRLFYPHDLPEPSR